MTEPDRETPKVKINMSPAKFIIMELAANGYGDPETLAKTRVDLVVDAYDYLRFKNKYERQYQLLRDRK